MAVLDELILQCLILDGRAPFRRIADVVGVSEQTVARRVRAMAGDGLARVVVRPSGFSPARRTWTVRIRCRPDAAVALANGLADRPDVGWVALVAGGGEITFTTTGSVTAGEQGTLARLPRSSAVLSFTAQALLRPFADSRDEWTMFDERLTDEQAAHLRREDRAATGDVTLDDSDTPLVAALSRDGRASAAALARDIGWPVSRVSARLEALLGERLLHVGTDFVPEGFGYHASAIMYLTVPPGRIIEVGEALAGHRQTGFVAATTGAANLLAAVTCRTSDHLFRYVTEQVGSLPDVRTMDLSPYLRRVKQFAGRVVDDRLVPGT